MKRIATLLLAMTIFAAAAGCDSNEKKYDIGPVFPLSKDKCAKYHGDAQGTGPGASCMVTKSECEKAAADWKQAMQGSGVNNAVEFSCG